MVAVFDKGPVSVVEAERQESLLSTGLGRELGVDARPGNGLRKRYKRSFFRRSSNASFWRVHNLLSRISLQWTSGDTTLGSDLGVAAALLGTVLGGTPTSDAELGTEPGVIPTLGLELGTVLGVTPTFGTELGTELGVIPTLCLELGTVLGVTPTSGV